MPAANSMQRLAQTCEAIAATTKKLEKTALVRDYLLSCELDTAAQAAVFLSARVFPAYEERTLNVGGSLLSKVITELADTGDHALSAAYRKYGDLGSAAHDVLLASAPDQSTLSVVDVARAFDQIAAGKGTAAKSSAARDLLTRATALEAKYIIKIMTGDLRIGLRESLVEEAIAKAYGDPVADVQRANMLLGDIAATVRLAADHQLAQARMRLFHPIGFMLASPAESADEAFAEFAGKRRPSSLQEHSATHTETPAYFEHAQVEDKYDGIRAQAHVSNGRVRLFSRTLDDITDSFPELIPSLAAFAEDVILDGEILAWRDAQALPFSQLQQRLGRKRVSESLMRDVPVAYVAFDVLYAADELVIERPLRERAELLDSIFTHSRRPVTTPVATEQGKLMFEPAVADASGEIRVLRAPVQRADSAAQLDTLFDAAQARGNEGLMIKDLNSPYAPGRRGRSWLKMKRQLATLDVVVTAVEFGHGKRARVLSDYTFAVRDGDQLVNIAKAYNGLTDREIADMTEWFMAHTTADHGFSREVEPKIVLEVAFNAIMKSGRHASGYALRFPRILRIRTDKPVSEIDTVESVEKIFASQNPHLKRLAGD
jgi:DNA ligase-1